MAPRKQSVDERFWRYTDKRDPSECWTWTGTVNWKGYGRLIVDGRNRSAPQIAWEVENGKPFPKGKIACHSCDNPICVNPDHIWPGTNLENRHDSIRKGRHSHIRVIHTSERRCCPSCGRALPTMRLPRKVVYPSPKGPYERWTITLAIKPYKCVACRGPIRPGELNAYTKLCSARGNTSGFYNRACRVCAGLTATAEREAA